MIKKPFERIAGSEVIHEVLDRDPCSRKHGGSAEDLMIGPDDGF